MSVIALGLLAAASWSAAANPPGYLPPGDARAGGARRIILIYNGQGHRKWQKDDFKPLLAHTTRSGTPLSPLFDTFLVLPLRLDNGRAFGPSFGKAPAAMADVVAYRDERLFGGDDQLRKLDRAVAEVATALHAPAMRRKVILALPYPDPAQRDFGAVAAGKLSLDLSRAADRLAMVEWYLKTARQRWNSAGFQHLDLIGWYWIHEQTDGEDGDLLKEVGRAVDADGGKFFWIPWFKAPGSDHWEDFGFDAAIQQPNYFFPKYKGTDVRLHDAAERAREYEMGMEIELDGRAITSPESRRRYWHYLRVGREEGFQTKSVLAWYMGPDALIQAAASPDPEIRAIYDATADFLAGK
jgi:hypothetical protein